MRRTLASLSYPKHVETCSDPRTELPAGLDSVRISSGAVFFAAKTFVAAGAGTSERRMFRVSLRHSVR